MTIKRFNIKAEIDGDTEYDEDGNQKYEIVSEEEANLVISRTKNLAGNKHAPVLDIDVPHKLVPSTTEGHSHLYVDVECDWEDYVAFLKAAVKIGLIEQGYADASINRGFSAVRKPGVKKVPRETSKGYLPEKPWLSVISGYGW